MTFEQWQGSVPQVIRSDALWKMEAYRLGLFAADLSWKDTAKLVREIRTRSLADQLYRAAGNISSNVAEGYSRGTGKDRSRFYEYALGSARETRDWYYKSRYVLGSKVADHRMELLTQLIKLLVRMSSNERRTNARLQLGTRIQSSRTNHHLMYKLLLIRKYLLRRRIAWVALLAVMLCTAMVLVVISVMGGWLGMFKSAFRGMTSDVVIRSESLTGFPYYQEMIDGIHKIPNVKAAVPVIQTFGLINIGNQKRKPVEVVGVPIDQIGQVDDFPSTLYRQHTLEHKQTPSFALLPNIDYQLQAQLAHSKARNVTRWPGMIVTDPVIDLAKNDAPPKAMYELPTTLTLVPVLPGESVRTEDAVSPAFWIVDNSRSQIYQLDSDRVYVPLDELQKDLRMTADEADGTPARVSEIQIKAVDGADLNAVRDQVQTVVDQVESNHVPWPEEYPLQVATWQQVQARFIDFVEHEVVLTTTLFGVISLVAILLIFCMFYMIVVEKTKDIGIIKSVGATGAGILSLFLGYGLSIGIVGGGLGLLLAYLVVHNINELHAWLGRTMGIVIWDPEAYQFPKIPNTMDPKVAFWVLVIAMVSALLGAVLPAIRAARMNPVEALRYE